MKNILIAMCLVASLFGASATNNKAHNAPTAPATVQIQMDMNDSEYYCNMEYDKCMDVCALQENDTTCIANCEDKLDICISKMLQQKPAIERQ